MCQFAGAAARHKPNQENIELGGPLQLGGVVNGEQLDLEHGRHARSQQVEAPQLVLQQDHQHRRSQQPAAARILRAGQELHIQS